MSFFTKLDAAFLARDLHRLRQEITEQSDLVLIAAEIDVPSSCTSLVLSLLEHEKSAAELSKSLGYSHQLVTQRINLLLRLGLVVRTPSARDARKKSILLTPEGARQTKRLQALLPELDAAFRGLFDEIGFPLGRACRDALQSLTERPVLKRVELGQLVEV